MGSDKRAGQNRSEREPFGGDARLSSGFLERECAGPSARRKACEPGKQRRDVQRLRRGALGRDRAAARSRDERPGSGGGENAGGEPSPESAVDFAYQHAQRLSHRADSLCPQVTRFLEPEERRQVAGKLQLTAN